MSQPFDNNRGECPNCGLASAFKSVYWHFPAWPWWGSASSGPELTAALIRGFQSPERAAPVPTLVGMRVLECLACNRTVVLLVRAELASESNGGSPATGRRELTDMVWPSPAPRELASDAPDEVRSLYAEASTCENAGAMRGAGVLYRAAVEELVKDQSATGDNLYRKIDSLRSRLPSELVDDLHEARMLGNDSIHDGLVYAADEVADVAGLIEEAVLVLYVQPAEKRRMRDRRKARRDGTAST